MNQQNLKKNASSGPKMVSLQKEMEMADKTQIAEDLRINPSKGGSGNNPSGVSSAEFRENEMPQEKQNGSPNILAQIPEYQSRGQVMDPEMHKQAAKPKAVWQTAWHYKFIQYWQTIFNRRIASFSCFALQIGDVIIFSAVVAFLVYCCLQVQDTSSSGSMAQIMMGGTVVFGCRNGLISYIFGLSLERAVLWHQLFAWITLGLSLNHWFCSDTIASGFMVLGPLMGFLFFSLPPIRRYFWELFMKMHWILIIVMIVGCIAHGVTVGVITIGYFFLDVAYRMYTVYMNRHCSYEMKLEKVGTNITKISMKNIGCEYKGGQYFFIMIPKLSYLQWHPFSVFSASYEEEIVLYVKCLGDWTGELYKMAGQPGSPVTIKGYLDGPYGSHSISIEGDKYQNFLMISGGIGVTPIISSSKEILAQMESGRPVKNLHFIWTGRDSAIIERVFNPEDLKSLLTQDNTQILQTFYHYSNSGDRKITDIEDQAKLNQHPIVELAKGRPNFDSYFETAFKKAKESGHSLVGVLTCGPQSLIDAVECSSMKWSKQGIRFDVHQEVFNF